MRVGQKAGSRAEWLDRVPEKEGLTFTSNAVAPHALTSRGSYTVPSNRKALVLGIQAYILRATAATTTGIYRIVVSITSADPGGFTFQIQRRAIAIDTAVQEAVTVWMLLKAADQLTMQTQDLSVGGTVDYHCSVNMIEFDA